MPRDERIAETRTVRCALAPCGEWGHYRIRRPNGGEASYCERCHALVLARDKEAEWLAAGRPTQEQSMERIRAILRRPGALSGLRVPGEDREEDGL